MKLHILCDLHIEFGNFIPPDVGADLVILAGDVHVKLKGVQWAKKHFRDYPVIYVIGNHEYYRAKFPGLINQLKQEAEDSRITVLENDNIEIDGFRIFGCTLWTDMDLFGNHQLASIAASEVMNDYRLIGLSQTYRKFSPKDSRAWHFRSIRKLEEFFKEGIPERSIVVTHHAPSARSIHDKFRNDAVTPAFASNMDDIIKKHQPLLWIHGHTHESFNYKIGKTRIICNPRGYTPQDNPGFRPDFTVEI